MRRKNALPELLAPAGDMQCLYAAVQAGADAVYVGGKAFGARAYAKNFDIDELSRATDYCHLHGVKLYVTVNTLIYDRELREVSDFLSEIWRIGVDAVITADLGVIREIKRRVPKLPIHASTQMSVHNTDGARQAAELGCERVVLARELSYENICQLTDNSPIETEIFLHGALCVCHSGQCLFSSLVGGRSGNRGECAQPCRLPYNNKYPLSLSDLSLAEHIEELIKSGVASLKIEGRMKSPEYVYTVTSIYRRLLDEGRAANREEKRALKQAFSRGDFTDGYFRDRKFDRMTGVRTEEDKSQTKELEKMSFEPIRHSVKAKVEIRLGQDAEMTLFSDKKTVKVFGDVAKAAISSPLAKAEVVERLCKMGATNLSLAKEDVELVLDEGVNLSPSAVNSLRRKAAQAFESSVREAASSVFEPKKCAHTAAKANVCAIKTAQFLSFDEYLRLKDRRKELLSFFDIVFLPLERFSGEGNGVYIPPIITDSELYRVEELLRIAAQRGAVYALVSNIGHIAPARRQGLIPIGDFRLNITNSYAREEYFELGISDTVLSPEITLPMARDIGGGEIVYGRIPLMLTERCFIKENFGCGKCNEASLSDRTGAEFPVVSEYGHRNLILNSRPTYMGDRKRELDGAGIRHEHFIFTVEKAEEIEKIISAYISASPLSQPVRRIGKR